MVFRGRLSKACERCRARRLKCDLHSPPCGQCVRAGVPCSGYRDMHQLRIRDESQSVARKASKNSPPVNLQSLSQSVDVQARDAFFAYYVTSTSKTWDFLKQYYSLTDTPDHLKFAIEAVSLAYFWHQVSSEAALVTARERYISALRIANQTLKTPQEATKETTLLTSLVLDLFEKITDSKPRNNRSWISHVNGALTLVKLRGLDHFRDPSEFRILLRLSINHVISCVASGSAVPDELIELRTYLGKHLNAQDPKWLLSDLMICYANLLSEVRRGILSNDEYITMSVELDVQLQALDFDMPPFWQRSTTYLSQKSERNFDFHFDTYSDRLVTQARNVLRLVRILLNESLIQHYLASPMEGTFSRLIQVAYGYIKQLVGEICASVPQYVDCDGPARQRLPAADDSGFPGNHPHTPDHQLDCYTLIFPLYVAGRSNVVPEVRPWAIKQLHYVGSHFYIRNAAVVAQILEREQNIYPWDLYARLGSYAFAA